MCVLAIHEGSNIILETGKLLAHIKRTSYRRIYLRRPSNCAYSTIKTPYAAPPIGHDGSPRPYSQLNSGTVLLQPSYELFSSIQNFLATHPKVSEWAFPDQDLLTEYFKGRWYPIPWFYNALRSHRNVHPALWSEGAIHCLHYIYADKPWQSRTTPSRSDAGFDIMDRWWWDRFDVLGKIMKKDDPEGWRLVLSTVDTHRKRDPSGRC